MGFGAGLSPYAPGTMGTLVGLAMYPLLSHLREDLYLVLVGAMFLLGIPLCDLASRRLGGGDHPGIVWDEIVGILFLLAFVPPGWGWVLAGFLVFRGFDILKPWPIRWLEQRLPGGLGIMADDLLAALLGIGVIQLVWKGLGG